MRLIAWNMAAQEANWHHLALDDRADIALLQEAVPPPSSLAVETIPARDAPWTTAGARRNFCAAIARLSDRVQVRAIPTRPLTELGEHELGVSLDGTLAACEVTSETGDTITAVSAYGAWEAPLEGGRDYADASVHRVISDLSALLARQRGHRLIVAGDLNILYGYGEDGSPYWRGRYQTIFTRMEAIGLFFIGPQHPSGEQATPWPTELPTDSKNVPTFRWRKNDPATAVRQLDFVFASRDLATTVQVRARNALEDWGPSDHCRIEIDVT